jgi:hypothetical protein
MKTLLESDWKLLQKSIDGYNDKLHRETLILVSEIINNGNIKNGDKLFKISKVISSAEKEMNSALYRISRSRFIEILLFYYVKGVLGDDLNKYSEETIHLLNKITNVRG